MSVRVQHDGPVTTVPGARKAPHPQDGERLALVSRQGQGRDDGRSQSRALR